MTTSYVDWERESAIWSRCSLLDIARVRGLRLRMLGSPQKSRKKIRSLIFFFYRLKSAVKSIRFMVVVQGWYLSHQSSILIYLEFFNKMVC